MANFAKLLLISLSALLFSACATSSGPKDYANFKASNPKSILILPPKNSSLEVNATYSVYSHTQKPLAESGFYVLPITLVDETFKSNGMTVAEDIHLIDKAKLHEIFGADAGLYIEIKNYGTKYYVVGSASVVTAEAKLYDLKNGNLLWEGTATASSEEGKNNQGGLAALLVSAIVKQIIGTVVDQSHEVAKITNARLLSAGTPNGILYGPHHPLYGK